MHALEQHLPPHGSVLDAGGGPGRYAIALCEAGHRVTLLDLSPGNVEMARKKAASQPVAVRQRLHDFVVGDVRDLSCFEQGSFDAVVCLDPLSHLPEEAGRACAVAEMVRVTKNTGVVCIGGRGYLALFRTMLSRFRDEILDPWVDPYVATGNAPVRQVPCHFFRANEIRQLAEAHGLKTMTMVGVPGLSSGLVDATNHLAREEAGWEKWIGIVLQTATEPSVVDTSEHLLYLGRVMRRGRGAKRRERNA
jgi:ubiquinone/menaquinone biosynthesis C-methylase UbiE